MSPAETLGLPADRSLKAGPAGWHSVSVECARAPAAGGAGPSGSMLAAACLIVFARLHRFGRLEVRLEGAWVGAQIEPDTSLAEVVGSLGAAAASPGTGARLNLHILAAAQQAAADDPADDPVMILQYDAAGDRLRLTLHSRRERGSELTAQDLLEKIASTLEALSRRPASKVADLSLITPAARGLVADPARPIPLHPYALAHEAFLQAAQLHPREPAIRHGDRAYTYAELESQARHLAERLAAAGATPGDIITISGRSSFGLMAGIIAIFMVGGVLVTIDEALPAERRRQIAGLAQSCLGIAVQSGPAPHAPHDPAATLAVCAWPDHAELAALEQSTWRAPTVPQDADAYVFFTSGSSGVPKGVLGVQRSLAHFLEWQRSRFDIGPGDRSAQVTALSFDAVLRDIFFPLSRGAAVCIPEREQILDARRMLAWFRDNRITVLHCVPSLMKAWLQADDGREPFASLRYIFFAGEPVTDGLVTRLRAAASPATRITNLYGATETTLVRMANPIDAPEPGIQPVGTAQPGVDVFIVRDRRRFCGLWETGEIAIRTPYRARGYFRNEELTRQAFVANPDGSDPGDLIYYTGDLGRLRADGKVEIFGRMDSQIKIRGVRIEPNEIEARMLELPGVRDAAVAVRARANEDKILHGFVVRDSEANRDGAEEFALRIRAFLRDHLHEAMVPSRVLYLDVLPYLPNGKLDRKALAAMAAEKPTEAQPAGANTGAAGSRILDPLRRLIPGPLRLDRSFIELGGDSLSFIGATLAIERVLGYVPAGWERAPLQRLVDADRAGPAAAAAPGACAPDAQQRHAFWARIEIAILIRAIAIVLVVIGHAVSGTAVTATSTLFLISGISFGRFLLPALAATGDIRPTLRFIAKFGIPAALWQLFRAAWMQHLWVPDLLLAGTMFEDSEAPHYTLWYLDILAASLLLLALLVKLRHAVTRGSSPGGRGIFDWEIAIVLAGLAASAVQIRTGIWDGILGQDSVGPFRWFWIVALGALTVEGHTARRKAALVCALGLAAVSSWLAHALIELDAFFFAAALLLMFVPRVAIPRFLLHPLIVVASSTLFIYIVNYSVIHHLMPLLRLPASLPLEVALALLVGIGMARVWDRFESMARQAWDAIRGRRGSDLETTSG